MATRRHCRRALEIHDERLSSLKNVVGLGIVPAGRKGSFAVAVYVTRKLPRDQLKSEDLVPRRVEIPGRGKRKHRIPTRVIGQGVVRLEDEFADENGLRG